MAKCPLTGDMCPQHNKVGGCEWWLSYTGTKNTLETKAEGCAIVLTPMLTLENANVLGLVAGEVNKVGAEVSAGRVENIREASASRQQLLSLALGERMLIKTEGARAIESKEAN